MGLLSVDRYRGIENPFRQSTTKRNLKIGIRFGMKLLDKNHYNHFLEGHIYQVMSKETFAWGGNTYTFL